MLANLLLLLPALAAAAEIHYHDTARQSQLRDSDRSYGQTNGREATAEYWANEAAAAISERKKRAPDNGGVARNIVMFLGDGMSVPTLAAARTLLGQRQGRTGEEAQLSFEAFPSVGLSKTYCLNAQIADSACTATAYLCGVKANSGTIGLTGAVPRFNCTASTDRATHVQSIAAWALQDGRDAGVVTTTRITHASPAGLYASVANRNWENDAAVTSAGHDTNLCPDIAYQLINMSPGNQLKVILGGGRREFLPVNMTDEENERGLRTDGRNLIEEWQASKRSQNVSHRYVWNRTELMELSSSPPDYLLGLFESNHMQYHLEANNVTEPTLAELTEVAIRSLSRNEKGFFLFVEGGRIDHGHHENYVHLALDETIELSKAVARAAELLSEDDSLLVVTADHAHVMAFNGYTPRGSDILGPSNSIDDNGVPYMTLSYTNGPGARMQTNGIRPNVLQDSNYGATRWRSHADVPLDSETHGGDDVAVFARGPHHHMFTGLYEQSQVPHLMAYAGCIGARSRDHPHCSAAHALTSPPLTALLLAVATLARAFGLLRL
ncbi:unnamed protein product [Chilo suppressalis]|nr:unnamed protein product [Chilo suppressalis]